MIELVFVNQSKKRLPRQFIQNWLAAVVPLLPARDRQKIQTKNMQMTVVFLTTTQARVLNREYRKKDYATDVLSFAGDGKELFGELALCPDVLVRQAKGHALTFRAELAYMVLHGLLHLLGYDHEGSAAKARQMFALQDGIFSQLQRLHSSP